MFIEWASWWWWALNCLVCEALIEKCAYTPKQGTRCLMFVHQQTDSQKSTDKELHTRACRTGVCGLSKANSGGTPALFPEEIAVGLSTSSIARNDRMRSAKQSWLRPSVWDSRMPVRIFTDKDDIADDDGTPFRVAGASTVPSLAPTKSVEVIKCSHCESSKMGLPCKTESMLQDMWREFEQESGSASMTERNPGSKQKKWYIRIMDDTLVAQQNLLMHLSRLDSEQVGGVVEIQLGCHSQQGAVDMCQTSSYCGMFDAMYVFAFSLMSLGTFSFTTSNQGRPSSRRNPQRHTNAKHSQHKQQFVFNK
jgi:hypothetical protein